MYQVKNNREAREAIGSSRLRSSRHYRRPCDAAAFIDMHGVRTRLWVTAETAVKCADRAPLLIDQAITTLENALRRDGMLD
jgi:hypothetical protein